MSWKIYKNILKLKCGDDMKKLNNRGWGLLPFLIIIAILFCTLLVVAYLAGQYGNGLPSSTRNYQSSYFKAF